MRIKRKGTVLLTLLLIFLLIPMVKFNAADELEDNFYAISESSNSTQWILQGNETLEEEVFCDDISNESWDLYGASERYFDKSTIDSVNYLLDNTTISSAWSYSGTCFSVYNQDTDPSGITWDGTHFWMLGKYSQRVYQYTLAGVYTGIYFNIYYQEHNPSGICWDGTHFWVVGIETDRVYQYTLAGVYTGTNFYVGDHSVSSQGITWDGIYFYILDEADDRVYRYTNVGVYTGTYFSVGAQETRSHGITWDGTHLWIVGYTTDKAYKYTTNGSYTGVYFSIIYNNGYQPAITWDGTHFWIVSSNDEWDEFCCKYEPLVSIFKNYFGSGYTYIQTNKLEEIGLVSSVYNSNCSLSSGDYFEVDFETNSNSEIKLELINGGLKVKELVLNSGQIFLDENVEFDQIRFTSLFTDQDYLKIFDIKGYNVTIVEHYVEFYVDPLQTHPLYLKPIGFAGLPIQYNLKIFEDGIKKVDEIIYYDNPSNPYYYTFYSPEILINSPHSNELFGNNSPSFNIEIKNNNGIDKMWYTLDNGLTNTTFTTNGTINQDLWDSLSNGTVIISFYVKDSIGNIGNNSIMLRVDKIGPFVKINSPLSNELFESTSPGFNVEISDANLDRMWYNINGEPKKYFFLTNGSLDLTAWSALPDGIVTIQFYANDTLGNIGSSEVAIRKDVNVPIIVITSPENNNVIGSLAPNFGIFIDEPNLENTWYSLNGGNNVTFTGLTGTINQALWDALPEGNVIIKFYANDTLGRIGFQEVTIVKMTSQPSPPGIPGYNILLLLGIVSTIAVVIVKKRLNRLN